MVICLILHCASDFLDLDEISYFSLDGAGDVGDVTTELIRKQFLKLKAFKSNRVSDMKNERQYVAKTVSVTEDFNRCLKIIVLVLTL